jgi:hypothetical protein
MTTMDDDTLRAMLEGLRCGSVHITADCTGDSRAVGAFCDLVRVAPALAAEVLRLRAERDELRAVCDGLRAVCDELYVDADRANGARDAACAAARAHLAADDALTLARRTDAADVPTAEARALAARETLAGLVGIGGGR